MAKVRASIIRACLVLSAWCSPAFAAESEPAPAAEPPAKAEQARALFKEGRELVKQGKHEEACRKFEQSLELDDGMGTRFNLAACYEKIGRTKSAYDAFLSVAGAALDAGQREREQVARDRAAALEPNLSRLQLDVAEPELGQELRLGEHPIERAQWGEPMAVDPGDYELAVTAPERKPWARSVTVPASGVLVVAVPKLEAQPAPPPPPPAAKVEPEPEPEIEAPPEPPPARDEQLDGRKAMRTAAYVVGGAGIASLVAGVTFALQYETSNNDARAVCRSGVDCTPEEIALHRSLVDDSKKAATLAYVGFGVGSVAMIGATLLFVSSADQVPVQPAVGLDGSWGASWRGSF